MDDPKELLQVVRTAESACALVAKRPEDASAQEALKAALAVLAITIKKVDPIPGAFSEAQVFADIVITRMNAFDPRRQTIRSLEAIRHPVESLLRILDRLATDIQASQKSVP